MHTKSKKILSLLLILMMVMSLLPAYAALATTPLATAPTETFDDVRVDGVSMKVDHYVDTYVGDPIEIAGENPANQQQVNIYVPENAKPDSPIILLLNNAGWRMNSFPTGTIVNYAEDVEIQSPMGPPTKGTVGSYSSATGTIGAALKAGYIVVSYGCRSRGQQDTDDNYTGHSPATVADTKAVIRYLRYNSELGTLPAGDVDRIVVTGTSGGGALSTLIASTGNSSDYFEELYNIGAAGIAFDGTAYTDTLDGGDKVYATIAYCPITDLPHADAAYEWVYGDTRQAYKDSGEKDFPPGMMGDPADLNAIYGDLTMEASEILAAEYVAYFNSLGLKDEAGKLLKADDGTFKDAIIGLLEKGAEKAAAELAAGSTLPNPIGDYEWIAFDENGKASIDWDSYLYWVGLQSTLKRAPAFDNQGTKNADMMMNENNLTGMPDQEYSHWTKWSWDNDTGAVNDGTYDSWDAFLASPEGLVMQQQAKMLNPMEYLLSATDGESAPYWYVRHGMADRDTSFAIGAALYYALINDASVEDVNFNFAWLKPHSGEYDVPEAFAWLAEALGETGPAEPVSPFSDVAASDWFFDDVIFAWESELIAGKTATLFAPNDNLTYAEAVKLAACMHQLYTTGEITLENGEPWYQSYVDYAKANDIISADYDWNAAATRAGYMEIFANALPAEALALINDIADGAIPDVPESHPQADAIYLLYRAGVLQGTGSAHNCDPDSFIKRSEVAAVLTRMVNAEARIEFTI